MVDVALCKYTDFNLFIFKLLHLFISFFIILCSLCDYRYPLHVSFPDDCVSVFDWNECDYKVHKKNDPSIECEIYGKVVI